MTTIKVNNIEYKIEFSFDAAETEEFVQKLFRFMTGSYLAENSEDMDNLTAKDVIFGGMVISGTLIRQPEKVPVLNLKA